MDGYHVARLDPRMRALFSPAPTSVGTADQRPHSGSAASRSVVPDSRKPRTPTWLVLGGLFLALYVLTMGGHLDSPDEELMFQVTRSMAEHGSMDINQTGLAEQLTLTGADGRTYVPYSPVASAMSVPLYLAAKPFVALLPVAYSEVAERFAVGMRDAFVTAVACLVFYALALELGFGATVALVITLAFGLSTLVWPYARHTFSEPVTSLWLLLSVFAAIRSVRRAEPAWSALSAVAIGLAIGSKATAGFGLPALLIYLAVGEARDWRARLVRLAPFVAVLLLAGVGLGIVNWARFGDPFETGYHIEGIIDFAHWTGVAGLLVSPSKSLFLYAPIALLGVAGLGRMAVDMPLEAALFFWLAASHVVFHGLLAIWSGDAAWGPRYLVPIVPYVVLPAGALVLWTHGRTRSLSKLAFSVLVGVGFVVNLAGVLVDQRVAFVWELQQVGGNFDMLDTLRWDPRYSPVVYQWQEFDRRVATFARSWSQQVTLLSGTYGKEAVDPIDATAAPDSDLFPRWSSGSAIFTLNNHGEPARMTVQFFDSRPTSLGPSMVQVLVNGAPLASDMLQVSESPVALPDTSHPMLLQATLDSMVVGHDSSTVEIRSRTWQPARDAPPNPDVRDLGIEIWDMQMTSNGRDLRIEEPVFSPMPVSDAKPWSYELQIWFYTPPHLADNWLWYLYLSGLPRWLLLLGLIPLAGLIWSIVELRRVST